ncbi:hypothetical protein RFN58_03885 [Streptomyces iakyrus]|uniref:hypothetical protein n=1 Tax=Streptomyces iakyrus TaxID=68219 RepID=UPI000524D777|nr:hypothetical protein [Streptomyces iakyrus]
MPNGTPARSSSGWEGPMRAVRQHTAITAALPHLAAEGHAAVLLARPGATGCGSTGALLA